MQTQETSIKSAESMTRTRIKREQITNEERRDSIFRKRMRSLEKKASELSVLCEINAAIVVHSRTKNNAILWPSPPLAKETLEKFMEVRSDERERRILTHEKLLEQQVQAEREEIKKLKKAMEMKESQQLMVKSLHASSFDGLTPDQLKGMSSFADDMLKKLAIKEMKLNNGQ